MRSRTPEEVAARTDRTIIDVREPDELAEVRVPGAVSIPMSTLQDRVDELPAGELDILCHSGMRSSRVTRFLDENGYDAVNIDGGIVAWEQAGLPVERG